MLIKSNITYLHILVSLAYVERTGNFEVIKVREHETTSEAMEKELRILRTQLSMTQNHLLAAMKTSLFPVSPTDSPRIIPDTSAPCLTQKVSYSTYNINCIELNVI